MIEGYTKKYNINKLVYYEMFGEIEMAIEREKQLKGWKREKKDKLIDKENVPRKDLYESLF